MSLFSHSFFPNPHPQKNIFRKQKKKAQPKARSVYYKIIITVDCHIIIKAGSKQSLLPQQIKIKTIRIKAKTRIPVSKRAKNRRFNVLIS